MRVSRGALHDDGDVLEMADSNGSLTDEALNRRATTLRQQFQRAKARLQALALEDSLLGT
jgi:hypothetical protein